MQGWRIPDVESTSTSTLWTDQGLVQVGEYMLVHVFERVFDDPQHSVSFAYFGIYMVTEF